MNEPQTKMSGEQTTQPKVTSKDSPFAMTSAQTIGIAIGLTLGIGFGPGVFKAIGEMTGWGMYTIATFSVGTLMMGVIGSLIGGISVIVINYFGVKV